MTIDDVGLVVRSNRFSCSTETELQCAIDVALSRHGLRYTREMRLGDVRFDFMLDDGTVIEIKIKGSLSALLRQLSAYAERDIVTALVVITTKAQLSRVPATINGKPLRAFFLLESCL